MEGSSLPPREDQGEGEGSEAWREELDRQEGQSS